MFDKIIVHTSFIGETGYANHSRNFFTALNKLIPVKVRNFTVGKTWRGLNNGEPHNDERYLTDEHKEMLYKQTCIDNGQRTDHYIYGGSEDDEKGNNLHIVLNEVNHYYFYDEYDGSKIAYNVWESTLYPDDFFNKLLEFDQLWVPTQWQKDCSVNQGYSENKIRVVPEAVDGKIFFPEEVELLDEYKDERFKFLLFGRWDYRKSTTEIIKSFLQTFNKDELVDLVVSIDNPFSVDGIETTEDRLKKYGFDDERIKIKHFPSREDYVKYLKTGHVFLSCARSEGWNLPLCVPEGKKVICNDDIMNIEDVKENDIVPTHKSCRHRVIKTMKRHYKGDLYKIRLFNDFEEISVTPDHPVYAIKRERFITKKNKFKNIQNLEPEWVDAKDIGKGDLIIKSFIDENKDYNNKIIDLISIDEKLLFNNKKVWYKSGYNSNGELKKYNRFISLDDLPFILGWYIAEGCDGKSKCMLTLNISEEDIAKEWLKQIKRVFGVDGSYTKYKTTIQLRVSSTLIAKFFSQLCGENAHCKRIPKEFLYGEEKNLKILIDEYSKGDGHNNGRSVSCSTVSYCLSRQLVIGNQRIGRKSSIHKNARSEYIVSWCLNNVNYRHSNKSWWHKGRDIAQLVKNVSIEEYDGYVYNFEVENDNSYILLSGTIHNCEAMACGTPSIYSNWGAQLEFAENKGIPVDINGEVLSSLGANEYFVDRNPGNYCDPNFEDLSKKMRDVYDNHVEYKEKSIVESLEIRETFSWAKVSLIAYGHIKERDVDTLTIVDNAYLIGVCQPRKEFEDFVNFIKDKKIKNVLEIGSDRGGSFYAWCKVASMDGKKISLDLTHSKFGRNDFEVSDRNNKMRSWSDNVFIVEADSHDVESLCEVERILNKEKIDLLFIDGDHSREGVEKDYEMYKGLVKDGGIIAFHDIKDTEYHRQAGCFVSDFWKDLKCNKKEIRDDLENYGGIGIINGGDQSLVDIDSSVVDIDNSIFIIGAWANNEIKKDLLRKAISSARQCFDAKILLVSHFPVSDDIQEMVDYYLYDKENPLLFRDEYEKYNYYTFWFFDNDNYKVIIHQPFRHDYAVWTSFRNAFNFSKYLGKENIFYLEYDCEIDKIEFRKNFIEPLSKYKTCFDTWVPDVKSSYKSNLFSIKTDVAVDTVNRFMKKEDYYRYCSNQECFILESVFPNMIFKDIGRDSVYFSDYKDPDKKINQMEVINLEMQKVKNGEIMLSFCKDDKNECYIFIDLRKIKKSIFYIEYNNVIRKLIVEDDSCFELLKIGDLGSQNSGIKVFEEDNIVLEKNKDEVKIDLIHGGVTFKKPYSLDSIGHFDIDESIKDKVLILFDSKSLGDNIAWVPYAEEFRKKHDCNVVLSTFWNDLFEKEYPEIEFIGRGKVVHNINGQHNIGWYQPWNPKLNPNDFRTIPLQQTATDILGLDYKEIRPKISIPDKPRNIEGKYVCIGMHSTSQAKYWNYPDGWQKITDYLNENGYKVVHISKEQGEYMGNSPPNNIIDKTGDFPIEDRLVDLKHADMFIGIGSGLSWLSWAVGTPTILISGFSAPFCEPTEGIERIHNSNVCNSCFNDPNITFDPGDWNWCPRNKDFECSKTITPEMVIDAIDDVSEKG